MGTLELVVPQDRDGTFSTKLFGRYQRTEQALVLTLMEMDIQGVSTRKVAEVTEQLCGTRCSKSQVSALAGRLAGQWRSSAPRVAEALEEEVEACLTCLAFPVEHQLRLRTTNGMERLRQELKRRTRVVRIFPNREACLRLVRALAMEQSDAWLSGRRYLDVTLLTVVRREPLPTALAAD